MAEHTLVTAENREAIIAAYVDGMKIREIEDRFGVKRSTVYWILEQDGKAPNRISRGRRNVGDDQTLAQLYQLIEAQHARITALDEAIDEAVDQLRGSRGEAAQAALRILEEASLERDE